MRLCVFCCLVPCLCLCRHTARFLVLWLLLLPLSLWGSCGWLMVPTVMIISFVLLGIEEIGVQIEVSCWGPKNLGARAARSTAATLFVRLTYTHDDDPHCVSPALLVVCTVYVLCATLYVIKVLMHGGTALTPHLVFVTLLLPLQEPFSILALENLVSSHRLSLRPPNIQRGSVSSAALGCLTQCPA